MQIRVIRRRETNNITMAYQSRAQATQILDKLNAHSRVTKIKNLVSKFGYTQEHAEDIVDADGIQYEMHAVTLAE